MLVEAAGDDAERLRRAGSDERDDMRVVRLGGRRVDLARGRRSLAEARRAAGARTGLAVVQLVGPPKDAWLARVRETGVRVVSYMAQNAYLVHGSAAELGRLARLDGDDPAVRAVTPYEVADKLAPGLATRGDGAFAVQTVAGAAGASARGALRGRGRALRGESEVRAFHTQYVEADAAAVRALAADPGVVAVLPYRAPRLLDERAAQVVAGNLNGSFQPTGPGYLSWLSGRGFGTGTFDFAIDVTDEGVDDANVNTAHPDFHENGNGASPSRVSYKRNWTGDSDARDCGGHGTNVASIAAGFNDGTGSTVEDADAFNYGLGIAPRARIGASKVFQCNNAFSLSGSYTDLAQFAHQNGARISNNSWGYPGDGQYYPDSQEYDAIVRDARPDLAGNQQLVELFANGNDGPAGTTVGAPGTAKNVISVGASESVRAIGGTDGCGTPDSGADSARDIIDFSSRGPTVDGRTKPDVVAPGTHVTGAQPQVGGSYDGDGTCNPVFPAGSTLYSLVSGTSQATPEASGFAALIRDHYRRTVGGGSTVPSPAMTKAIMVNTAVGLAGGSDGNGGTLGSAPDQSQGWGRISGANAFDSTTRQFTDQTVLLSASGQQHAARFDVADASRPVKISLVWSDAPGPTTGNAFVNDLDLRVTRAGTTFRGNVMSGGVSIPGGAPDVRNNVENVFFAPGTTGSFTVDVAGTTIAGDGVPGNGDATDQDFALVVSNASPAVNQGPTAALTATPNPLTAGATALLDASGSSDPDGSIANYSWDLDGDGTFETGTGALPTVSRAYSTAGVVNVAVRVTDDLGATADAGRALVVEAPVRPVDVTRPRASLRLQQRRRIRDLLARRMRVSATCDEPCTLTLELRMREPRAGTARTIVAARARGRLTQAGTRSLRLVPTRAGRRALRRVPSSVRATLRLRAVDAARNTTTVRRTVRLRR